MNVVGLWFVILLCFYHPTFSLSSTKSEGRRMRHLNNCKPGRRVKTYVDSARLWERDVRELRLYLDKSLTDLARQLESIRSQVADVGNEVSRLVGQECDSSPTPLHLYLERLENHMAGLLVRLEGHIVQPETPEAKSLVQDNKTSIEAENDFTIPEAKPTSDINKLNESVKHDLKAKPHTKQTHASAPCFWYELPTPKQEAFSHHVSNQEESAGLQVCSQSDPGQSPKTPLKDCSDGPKQRPAGVYWVQPQGMQSPFKVFCDSDGWTVIQRRGLSPRSSPENFKRSWSSYARGFGNLCADFWLGNHHLHRLTNAYNATLRVQMQGGKSSFTSTYKRFQVGNEQQGFPLDVGEFSGNAKDGLAFQSGMPFATADRAWSTTALVCADLETSGWWVSETAYSHFIQCNHHLLGSNLNAPFAPFTTLHEELVKLCPSNNGTKDYQRFKYANAIYWRGKYITRNNGFNTIEMKMRPRM